MHSIGVKYNEYERVYKTDYRLSLVVCWMMISLFLINALNIIEHVIGISADQISNISKGILVILFLFNINRIIKRIKKQLLGFIIVGFFVYFINILFTQNNPYFFSTTNTFFVNILPLFIVVTAINDRELLLSLLTKVARILVLMSLIVLLLSGGKSGRYSMGFSNSLTLPIILTLYDYYKTRAISKLILSFWGIVVIIVLGSRGALIGIGVYAIILLWRGVVSKQNRIKSLVFIITIILALVFYEDIINISISILNKFGIYSRTLYLFLNDLTHDSGRNVVYEAIIKEIRNHPFVMHGIAGEYLLTNGFYAHNFVLELLCDFGVLVGGIALIGIFWNAINTVIRFISQKDTAIDMMFLVASLPVMFVSGSIWTTTYFWLWLATILCKVK